MNQTLGYKRVWIRRPEGVPTALQVTPDDLVDDLKTMVMQKYPTSLARDYDPADLVLRLELSNTTSSASPSNANQHLKRLSKVHPLSAATTLEFAQRQSNSPVSPIPISSTKSPLLPPSSAFQRPNSRNEDDARGSRSPFNSYTVTLRPDQNIWKLLEHHFPHGMSMNDALVIDVPQLTPTQLEHPASRHRGSSYSSVFSSYVSPLKNESPAGGIAQKSVNNIQSQSQSQQLPKYPHSLSFSGDLRLSTTNKRQTPTHRRSQSNPQSPQSAVFSTANNQNNNNTTILMLPKDYNGVTAKKEKNQSLTTQELKQRNLDKITDKQEPSKSLSSSTSLATVPNTKKIKSTTEKVFPSINVLIVEDNKINQKILQAFLRKRKINFETAVNGEEAIQKWKQGGFHLVLMDIQLPVKSGIEAAMEIRRMEKLNKIGLFSSISTTNNTKLSPQEELDLSVFRSPVIIVALTASTSNMDRQKALAAGCNDYLTKPVNLDWLQNKITEWGCMQALIDFDHWKD